MVHKESRVTYGGHYATNPAKKNKKTKQTDVELTSMAMRPSATL